jgi:chromosome partitioning protein
VAGRARVIAIANQKGGVGKTTTAVNLGASLAVLERRVLVIDLDPQGAVPICFGIKRSEIKGGMFDVFVRGESIEDLVLEVGRIKLGVVPVNTWSDEDEEAYMLAVRPEILVRALDILRSRYDYVLIDNPPTIGPIAVASLVAADSVLIPVQCEELAVRTVGRLLRMARKVRAELNHRLRLEGIVLTMADSRTTLTTQVINTMRRNFGRYLFRTVVPRSVDLARIAVNGEPLVFTSAAARGARSYLSLAGEIIARETGKARVGRA